MPRYFFHLRDGEVRLDHDGTLLADPEAARVEAVKAAAEVLKDSAKKFWSGTEWHFWVVDESGATVCSLKFAASADGGA